MRQKIKTVYETPGELKAAIDEGTIKVGDEFLTFDIDDDAVFVVAHVDKRKVRFVRKYLLENDRAMKTDESDLMAWLNGEYKNCLPDDLKEGIYKGKITIPTEAQVFGKNEIGKKEYRKQWDYFKKTKNRIATHEPEEKYSKCWWLNTPYYNEYRDAVSSAYFALANLYGHCTYDDASSSLGVRPAFTILRS